PQDGSRYRVCGRRRAGEHHHLYGARGARHPRRGRDTHRGVMILTNARILTFDPETRVLDAGSVEVLGDGAIGSVRDGRALDGQAVDLHGRLLMPALINCHTHLYSTLARGMRVPGPPPADFPSILKKLWWRLDRALTEEDVYYSALIGLIDLARLGVGAVIDDDSSPPFCA